MPSHEHRIAHTVFNFHQPNGGPFSDDEALAAWLSKEALPALEPVLNTLASGSETLQIDHLTLNLPDMDAADYKRQLPTLLANALREALHREIRKAQSEQPPSPLEQLNIEQYLALLTDVLRGESIPSLVDIWPQLMGPLAASSRDVFFQQSQSPWVRKRIAEHFSQPQHLDIFELLAPGNRTFFSSLLSHAWFFGRLESDSGDASESDEPQAQHTVDAVERTRAQTKHYPILVEFTLAYLVSERGSQFNQRSFLRRHLQQIAASHNLNFETLCQNMQTLLMRIELPNTIKQGLLNVLDSELADSFSDSPDNGSPSETTHSTDSDTPDWYQPVHGLDKDDDWNAPLPLTDWLTRVYQNTQLRTRFFDELASSPQRLASLLRQLPAPAMAELCRQYLMTLYQYPMDQADHAVQIIEQQARQTTALGNQIDRLRTAYRDFLEKTLDMSSLPNEQTQQAEEASGATERNDVIDTGDTPSRSPAQIADSLTRYLKINQLDHAPNWQADISLADWLSELYQEPEFLQRFFLELSQRPQRLRNLVNLLSAQVLDQLCHVYLAEQCGYTQEQLEQTSHAIHRQAKTSSEQGLKAVYLGFLEQVLGGSAEPANAATSNQLTDSNAGSNTLPLANRQTYQTLLNVLSGTDASLDQTQLTALLRQLHQAPDSYLQPFITHLLDSPVALRQYLRLQDEANLVSIFTRTHTESLREISPLLPALTNALLTASIQINPHRIPSLVWQPLAPLLRQSGSVRPATYLTDLLHHLSDTTSQPIPTVAQQIHTQLRLQRRASNAYQTDKLLALLEPHLAGSSAPPSDVASSLKEVSSTANNISEASTDTAHQTNSSTENASDAAPDLASWTTGYQDYTTLTACLDSIQPIQDKTLRASINRLLESQPLLLHRFFRELQINTQARMRFLTQLSARSCQFVMQVFWQLRDQHAAMQSSGLARAINQYAGQSGNKTGFYQSVLDALLTDQLIDLEKIRHSIDSRPPKESATDASPPDEKATTETTPVLSDNELQTLSAAQIEHQLKRLLSQTTSLSEYDFARLTTAWIQALASQNTRVSATFYQQLLSTAQWLHTLVQHPLIKLNSQQQQRMFWQTLMAAITQCSTTASPRVEDVLITPYLHALWQACKPQIESSTDTLNHKNFKQLLGQQVALLPVVGAQAVKQQILTAIEDVELNTSSKTQAQRDANNSELRYGPDDSPPLDTIACHDAGLALIALYLPSLFERMNLTDNGQMTDMPAIQKALQALAFIGWGDVDHALPGELARLMVGVPVDYAYNPTSTLTDQDKELITGLLNAVIAHWQALGSTSPQGLREIFLQRGGRLTFNPERGWVLDVETATFDMLIDRIPWSYNTIKHSFMEHAVYVNWR